MSFSPKTFLPMPHWPLSDMRTRRARVAPVTSRPVLRHLSCGREVATSEEPRGHGCVNAGARRAWALAGPGRGCGGGGGDGRTADGLVESPRRLSPFHTRGAGRYRGRPGTRASFGLARPRLRCVLAGGTTSPGPTIAVSQVLAGPFRPFPATRRAGSRLRFVHARIHLFVFTFFLSHFVRPAWGQLISSAASSILVCLTMGNCHRPLFSLSFPTAPADRGLEKHITCLLSVDYRPCRSSKTCFVPHSLALRAQR